MATLLFETFKKNIFLYNEITLADLLIKIESIEIWLKEYYFIDFYLYKLCLKIYNSHNQFSLKKNSRFSIFLSTPRLKNDIKIDENFWKTPINPIYHNKHNASPIKPFGTTSFEYFSIKTALVRRRWNSFGTGTICVHVFTSNSFSQFESN